jgi:hypothetical protein
MNVEMYTADQLWEMARKIPGSYKVISTKKSFSTVQIVKRLTESRNGYVGTKIIVHSHEVRS